MQKNTQHTGHSIPATTKLPCDILDQDYQELLEVINIKNSMLPNQNERGLYYLTDRQGFEQNFLEQAFDSALRYPSYQIVSPDYDRLNKRELPPRARAYQESNLVESLKSNDFNSNLPYLINTANFLTQADSSYLFEL